MATHRFDKFSPARVQRLLHHKATVAIWILSLGCVAAYPQTAMARCELAPAHGGTSKNCGSGGAVSNGSSDDKAAAAAAIGAGLGLIIQGLANQGDDDADRQAEESKRWLNDYERRQREGKTSAEAMEKAAVGRSETNPWAKGKGKSSSKAKTKSLPKHANPLDCIKRGKQVGMTKVWNSCSETVRFKYWDDKDCVTGCIREVLPGEAAHLELTRSTEFGACYGDCKFDTIKRPGTSKTANFQSTASKSKAQDSSSTGYDINPVTKEPCVLMNPGPTKKLYSGGSRYDYTIQNTCDKHYNIHITTHAGWTVPDQIGPGKTKTWFCTDGFRGNKDCKGGVQSYQFR
ncbi:hypothetical protein [Rhizobium sp. MHM7A]|uniref:hypothetical protein n=1 Tax=Rhizobium sp. MHM7A TaxID=2583233 RepID=UPI001106AF3D|nr:hypothetical protein [Rhizobium sp. MHM7A]TLX15779.1 hypothetical protein FFR93_00235 [Rhizobium sp. MHM7A]